MTLACRSDPLFGGGGGDGGGAAAATGSTRRPRTPSTCLGEVYSVCAWVDGMSAARGCTRSTSLIDASGLHYERYEIGPIIVLMCDSPSLRAG